MLVQINIKLLKKLDKCIRIMTIMVQNGMAVVKGIPSVVVARSITIPKAAMFIQLLRRLKEKGEMRDKPKKISIIRVIN